MVIQGISSRWTNKVMSPNYTEPYDISGVVFTEPLRMFSSTFDSIFKYNEIASGKNNKELKFHRKKMIWERISSRYIHMETKNKS
jgi:hypothetical protein